MTCLKGSLIVRSVHIEPLGKCIQSTSRVDSEIASWTLANNGIWTHHYNGSCQMLDYQRYYHAFQEYTAWLDYRVSDGEPAVQNLRLPSRKNLTTLAHLCGLMHFADEIDVIVVVTYRNKRIVLTLTVAALRRPGAIGYRLGS